METLTSWLSLISFVIIVAISGASIYFTIVLFFKNKKQLKVIEQLVIDNTAIESKLAEYVATKNVEESEGFLRFVSQSRDWAFEYIETVQSEITKFVEEIGPTMEYYDKFGRINESPSMNKIFDAYSELIKVLPESNEKQGETK